MAEQEISNVDVVIYALYRLGGAEKPVDTEDVALECWRLAPSKFSWKKYPQYPESEPARIALFDAAKPKYGSLVRGRNKRTGWMLTVCGIDHIKAKLAVLQQLPGGSHKLSSQHTEVDRFFRSVEREPAFMKFKQTGDCKSIQAHEFAQLLKCPVDAVPTVLRDRLEKLKSRARDAERSDISEFLQECELAFINMLAGT